MKRLAMVASFVVGCAVLLAAFGIGWANWWELANRIGVVQTLMGALGVVVALLVAMGVLSKGKERWTALVLVAILAIGFSGLTIASTGIIVAPVALLLLGLFLWRLHRQTEYRAS